MAEPVEEGKGQCLIFKGVYNPILTWLQCRVSSLEYNAWVISKDELMPKCFIVSHWGRVHSKIQMQLRQNQPIYNVKLSQLVLFKTYSIQDIFQFLYHYFNQMFSHLLLDDDHDFYDDDLLFFTFFLHRNIIVFFLNSHLDKTKTDWESAEVDMKPIYIYIYIYPNFFNM